MRLVASIALACCKKLVRAYEVCLNRTLPGFSSPVSASSAFENPGFSTDSSSLALHCLSAIKMFANYLS